MRLIDNLLARIAPYECLVCGTEGALICTDCTTRLGTFAPSRCYRCLALTEAFRTCTVCRAGTALESVRTTYTYDGYVKELVKEFKFNGKRAAAKEITQLMRLDVPENGNIVFVHIPTATARIRERGYDHAKLLAAALSTKYKIPHLTMLQRTSQVRQLGASRSERIKNIDGVFRLTAGAQVRGAHIIIVDDVVTTGATLTEAAKVLYEAGARRIEAVVFAQTPL